MFAFVTRIQIHSMLLVTLLTKNMRKKNSEKQLSSHTVHIRAIHIFQLITLYPLLISDSMYKSRHPKQT